MFLGKWGKMNKEAEDYKNKKVWESILRKLKNIQNEQTIINSKLDRILQKGYSRKVTKEYV